MQNRREILFAAVAAGLATTAPGRALAEESQGGRLKALLDLIMDIQLRTSPETTAGLGRDTGDLAWTKATLSDRSVAALEAGAVRTRNQLSALRQLDRSAFTGMDAVNYDTIDFVLTNQDETNRRFNYGGNAVGVPYVLSQLSGAYQTVPDFLDNQHGIEARADADAYLARLEAFARLMDQETAIARRDYADGAVPPDFVIDKTLVQMKAFADTPAAESPLIISLTRRTAEKAIAGDWAAEAARLYEGSVLPALRRQIALLESVRSQAVHDAGCWRLKDGADYYAVALSGYTTSTVTPDEVHQMGLDQVASISAEMDGLFRSQGRTEGTVGERLAALYADPTQRYEDTDAGKARLIDDLNAFVRTIQARLPDYFGVLPNAPLEIRRVPKAIEAGAPAGYYHPPSLDGARPGIYWINLRDTAEQPSFILRTLTAHEGIPGHHLQIAISNEAKDLPLLRKAIWFSGYGEGWALYAEELAVEMGLYEDDPLGHIGMLHDALYRAVRLVVDSGMHHKRWSREQAVDYMSRTLGDKESSSITEVERYVVWPGQACSYMVGKLTWLKVREKARRALGDRFDIRQFHDAALVASSMPLTALERTVDDYIVSQGGRI